MIASMEVVIMTKTQNLTKGNTPYIILRFFFPMLLTNLLQQIYSFADTAIVGKGIGDNVLAAVGNMSSLTFLILGFSVVISQYYGAGDHSAMRKAVENAVGLSLWIAVILTVFSTVFLQPITLLMKTPEVILKESLTYGYIMFGGLAVTVAYNLCSGILRCNNQYHSRLRADHRMQNRRCRCCRRNCFFAGHICADMLYADQKHR